MELGDPLTLLAPRVPAAAVCFFGTQRETANVNSSGIGTPTARTCVSSQLHVSSALLRPGAHVVRVALTKSNARVDVVAMPFPAGPAKVLLVVVVLIEDVDVVPGDLELAGGHGIGSGQLTVQE